MLCVQCSTAILPQVVYDLLPGISLMTPPCVSVNEATTIELHFNCPVSHPDKFKLVGMSGGAVVLEQEVTEETGVLARW